MKREIYNQLLENILENKIKVDNPQFIQSLLTVNYSLSEILPVRFGELSPEIKANWIEGLKVEKINTPLNLSSLNQSANAIRILTLYDNKFLLINSDAPIGIYDENMNYLRNFPFEFNNDISATEHTYFDVVDACSVNYKIDNISGSMIFVCMKNSHIVQVYNYTNGTFLFKKTLGTVDTPGETVGKLTFPSAISAYQDAESLEFNLFIYNENVTSPYLQKIVMNTEAVISSDLIISRPDHLFDLNSDYEGSLNYSETKFIKRIKAINQNNIFILNNNSLGLVKLTDDNQLETIRMINGDIAKLEYNDVFEEANCIDIVNDKIVVADVNGHIGLLENDFKLNCSIGRYDSTTTEYPLSFKTIIDVISIGKTIYFISNKNIYKTNLAFIPEVQSYTLTIPDLLYDYTIEGIFGFNGEISLKTDTNEYTKYSDNLVRNVNKEQTLYLKVSVTKDELLKNDYKIKDGVVLIRLI